jgi:hypothetical protein
MRPSHLPASVAFCDVETPAMSLPAEGREPSKDCTPPEGVRETTSSWRVRAANVCCRIRPLTSTGTFFAICHQNRNRAADARELARIFRGVR